MTPNLHPTAPSTPRLAVIGDAPDGHSDNWHVCPVCGSGYDEAGACLPCRHNGRHVQRNARPLPFQGPAGKLLTRLLEEIGLDRERCFVGNVCQTRAPGDVVKALKWNSEAVQAGLAQLRLDLATFQPSIILCLGSLPLRTLQPDATGGVDAWRGSVFEAGGIRCIATYHPASILRDWSLLGIVRFDYRKLQRELTRPALVRPVRNLEVDLTVPQMIERLDRMRTTRAPVTLDIEGYIDWITCIGFADSAGSAFVVPFITLAGESWWSEEDEIALWMAIAALLEDPAVPKIGQNLAYDTGVLAHTYGIAVRGIASDTMILHWELWPEFPKALGFAASHLTEEAYYKFERKKAKAMEETREEEAEEV